MPETMWNHSNRIFRCFRLFRFSRVKFWCTRRIHLWFRWMGGLQAKSMTSQRYRATYKMADIRYYGNVMTTRRWRLYVTMETLWQQQDGGYALLFYIFNSTVVAWTCFFYVFLTSPICATCHIYLILLCSCTLVGIWCTCNAKLLLYVILSSPLIYFL